MKRAVMLVTLLVLSGCYHATVNTGLAPSAQQITKRWASGWVLGLVPPGDVNAMEQCPNGVARVETQLSFLNQLVYGLTWGIYTPMTIVVTCAAPGEDQDVVNSAAGWMEAVGAGRPFYVRVN